MDWMGLFNHYRMMMKQPLFSPKKPMENKIKCVIYCRVSSKEQEDTGYSLDSQKKLLIEHAEKQNLKVEKEYRISESASGKQIRKSFIEMLQYANKHKISAILCEKIDRLTRNMKDAVSIDEWVSEDSTREVHFVKENFVLNKNTKAHENLVWDMKVAIAKFYTKNLSEEVKKGQKEKIAQGGYPSQAKLGYKTIGEKGHKTHIPDEPRASFVKETFELYSTGNYSLKALVEVMYSKGLRYSNGNKVLKSRIHELLSDPFYMGKIEWNGQVYPGTHKPIVSKSIYEEVQQRLVRTIKNPQYKKYFPVFKAKVTCEECSGRITWSFKKSHWYGWCNHYNGCTQKGCTRQEKIEEQLVPLVKDIAPRDKVVLAWLEKTLMARHGNEVQRTEGMKQDLHANYERTQRRIGQMYEDKLDGRISTEFYDQKVKEYKAEQENLMESLSQLNNDNTKYYEAGYAIHELALKAWDIYQSEKATVDDKRLLLFYVFSNITLNKRKVKADYTMAYAFLADWMPVVNNFLELTKNPSINGALVANNSRSSESVLPGSNVFLEPQVAQILPNESIILSLNSEQCSAARTRTWNHLLTHDP